MSMTKPIGARASTDHRLTADSFGIRLSERWTAVPLDPAAFAAFRSEALRAWRQIEGWTKTDERRLDATLAKLRADLGRLSVRFAAFFLDLSLGDTGNVRSSDPLMAACGR